MNAIVVFSRVISVVLWLCCGFGQAQTAIRSLQLSADGTVLAAATSGSVVLWDAVNNKRSGKIFPITPIKNVALSADGATLVTLHDADFNIGVWDTLKQKLHYAFAVPETVEARLTSDAQKMLLLRKTAFLQFDMPTRSLGQSWLLPANTAYRSLAEERVLSYGVGLAEWQMNNLSTEALRYNLLWGGKVLHVGISPSYRYMVAVSDMNWLYVYRIGERQPFSLWQAAPETWESFSIADDGQYVLSKAKNKNTISLWNAMTGKVVQELKTPSPVTAFVLTSGSFYTGHASGEVYQWSLEAKQMRKMP